MYDQLQQVEEEIVVALQEAGSEAAAWRSPLKPATAPRFASGLGKAEEDGEEVERRQARQAGAQAGRWQRQQALLQLRAQQAGLQAQVRRGGGEGRGGEQHGRGAVAEPPRSGGGLERLLASAPQRPCSSSPDDDG